jgi:oligoribonuclease
MTENKFDGFVFVDLETTGLDEDLCEILELGILVTDKNFNVLGEFSEVCYFDLELSKNGIDDFVIQMHEKNGLWNACAKAVTSRLGVEKAAIEFLEGGGWTQQPLTGSTISFDRGFLKVHMPRLEGVFHYRNIDVSSLKGLFNKFGWPRTPSEYESYNPHRSLSDCYDTMRDLRSYTEAIDRGMNHYCGGLA